MGRITPETVFLVSGGARGITAQCVIEMARHFRCKFVLLGRTALKDEPAWTGGDPDADSLKKRAIADMQARGEKPTPALVGRMVNAVLAGREIEATVRAIKAAGGDAAYLSADITDAAALRAALETVRHLGAVTGIIHGAGNLADKLIENKTEADFESVYAAKVEGLEHMLAAVPAESLRYLVLFSSVAGFYGNVGQADYAIANEVLNKAAHRFRAMYPNCRVISINWGPWDGGMVTPQLRSYFDGMGIKLIPVDVGAQMLVAELSADAPPAPIVVGSPIQPQPTLTDSELKSYRLQRRLRLQDSPFLGDHVVNGQAVLPMVSAMSWMANACEQIHRGYRYFSFENYRVLKGIVFDEEMAPEHTLELKEVHKDADEIRIDATIRSANPQGKPRFHYSTQVILRAHIPEAPVAAPTQYAAVSGASFSGTQLYSDGTLFHGPSFQGVQQVLNLDEHGLMMYCQLPVSDADYHGQFPVQAFNYFMADIGLQSIGIWARKFCGMGSLPLRAARGEHFMNVTFGQQFYVTMAVQSRTETNVTANVTLHDEDQRIYMLIEDLEVTMSLRLNELFLNNRLAETNR